jgi:3-oxoacyl-[acyl-carrier protein] reductase
MSLSGRHVVVTGASGRLGRTVVDVFVEAGARVTAVDQQSIDRHGVKFRQADLNDETSVEQVFGEIGRDGDAPEILVHAVGMWGETPVDSATLDEWRTMVDVNLTSTFLCFREAVRSMASGGRLIAFASGQGADRAAAGQAAYSAAKAGVIRLVESTDEECRDRGIRAFAIAPSMILFGDDEGAGVRDRDLAELCCYLATDAGASLAGQVLRAYGTR